MTTNKLIQRVYAAVDYMMELDYMDRQLVVEMSQAMLNDILQTGSLQDMIHYVRHYCDVIDSEDDAIRIANDI